jgi:hypothetical protein
LVVERHADLHLEEVRHEQFVRD